MPLHVFTWTDTAGRVGLKRDAMYLVRPDGHVALADAQQDVSRLRDHLAKFGVRVTASLPLPQ